jgi:hypothetical protein
VLLFAASTTLPLGSMIWDSGVSGSPGGGSNDEWQIPGTRSQAPIIRSQTASVYVLR